MKSKLNPNIHRIKIIEGHVKAIEQMIENDSYCIDILNQSLAVQKALKSLDMKLMENHLKHCVIKQARQGETEKIVTEMLGIYKYKV